MIRQFNRRRFLALSTAAAAGATFFDAPAVLQAAGLAKKDDPYDGFPMGAQSYSLRNFNVVDAVRHLQGMGLHYVEFFDKHLSKKASDGQIKEVQNLVKKADISISAHGVNGFSKNHEANRAIFEFAKRAGLKTMTANPTKDSFDSLDKLCEEFQIRIAIHNHGPGALYDKIADTKNAIKDHHKLIGACVDTGHYIRSNEDPIKAVMELSGRVYGVHVKDDTHKGDKGSHNVVIGEANLDVPGLFAALRKVKFPADGSLSLEYEANPKNPMEDMKACLVVAREAIAKAAKK